jgi:hypothetical protein
MPDESSGNGIEIWGSGGAIVSWPLYSKDSCGTLLLTTPEGARDESCGPGKPIHEDVIEHFRQAIVAGERVLAPAEDALAGLEIIAKAYRGQCGCFRVI